MSNRVAAVQADEADDHSTKRPWHGRPTTIRHYPVSITADGNVMVAPGEANPNTSHATRPHGRVITESGGRGAPVFARCNLRLRYHG